VGEPSRKRTATEIAALFSREDGDESDVDSDGRDLAADSEPDDGGDNE